MNKLVILIIIFLFFTLKTKESFSEKQGHPELKNIYGQPLINCNFRDTSDPSGSWDEKGYCSEKGGGVHQVCFDVTDKSRNFARDTGQESHASNWSLRREGKNHCMCLGAWANYKAKQQQGVLDYKTDKELVCDAIPESVFNTRYFNAFNREQPGMWQLWNGEEKKVANQASVGLDELVRQCSKRDVTLDSKQFLKNKYCSLAKNNPELQSMFYNQYCVSPDQVEYLAESSNIITELRKFGDTKMQEIINNTSDHSLKNLIRVTHEMCAQMRFSPSISTALLTITNKDNNNPMKFYISVCCSSDYCEFFKNKFYYKKYNNGDSEFYLLFKRRSDETVQVLTQEYDEKILYSLSKSEQLEKMCKKHKQ